MQQYQHDGSSFETIVERHGPWSAMAIRLGDGRYTREPAIDYRLKRLIQVASDLTRKPLSQCRVLDLACLEGHYGIELAMHGAETVFIDIREANLAKTAYAIDALGLRHCRVYKDDVRAFHRDIYGDFDIIVCSGILYHLPARDAAQLVQRMQRACRHLCLIDTYVAMREDHFVEIHGRIYAGIEYLEHDIGTSIEAKTEDLWASIDNNESFWFTLNGLATLLQDAGFTSCSEVLLPTHPDLTHDRRMLVALNGAPAPILTSALTHEAPHVDTGLHDPTHLHPAHDEFGPAYRWGKRILPQSVKDAIKPALRRMGVLKTVAGASYDHDPKHGH